MTLRINRYPKNGFGDKSGQFYLINEFGHIFDIHNIYVKFDDSMIVRVNYYNRIIYADDIEQLIKVFDTELNIKIKNW